jgi:hypothetical protein
MNSPVCTSGNLARTSKSLWHNGVITLAETPFFLFLSQYLSVSFQYQYPVTPLSVTDTSTPTPLSVTDTSIPRHSTICHRYYKIFALNSIVEWKGLAALRMCADTRLTSRPSHESDGKHTRVPNKRTKRRTVMFLSIVISVVVKVELCSERETATGFLKRPQVLPRTGV